MANNRIWLYHRPTGEAICLGKRMGMGYYAAPEMKAMEAFYDRIEDKTWVDETKQDDFMLVLEVATHALGTYRGEWHYEDAPAGGIRPKLAE